MSDMLKELETIVDNTVDQIEEDYQAWCDANRDNDWEAEDEARESMEPLSVEVLKRIEILITCGGPDIRLFAEIDRDGDVVGMELHGRWGIGDIVTRHVYQGENLWDWAMYYIEPTLEVEQEKARGEFGSSIFGGGY